MNREIKFRGLTAKGEFRYGALSPDLKNSTAYWSEYSQRIIWFPECGGSANAPVKNGTVGQFTGLQDSKGNDIYEGDIVYIAGYGNYICEFPFLELYEAMAENDIGEILGNIYEKPELIE